MNFFDDDFGLGSTPMYTRKQSTNSVQKGLNTDQMSRKSAKKDEFDDLLDGLLNKEEKKNTKKREKESMQPYSSTYLEPNPPINDFKKTQKWSTPNIEFDILHQSPKFPNVRQNSLMDERGSEDGRSYKSGATGRNNAPYEFDNLVTLRPVESKEDAPFLGSSMRNMMKPPLRKKDSKEQLKEPSLFNDDFNNQKFSRNLNENATNVDLASNTEIRGKSREERNNSPEERVKFNIEAPVKQRIIEKEKIITVREEATELRKQFENEIKEIKDSYERQLKSTAEKLKAEMEQSKKGRTKLIKEYQEKMEQERKRWQKLMDESQQRTKDMHQWEMKKKCEAYEMQIQKLRSISKIEDNLAKQQNKFQSNQESIELKARQRQLYIEKQKIDELKNHLDQRQRDMQFQQKNFDTYRRKEEEKLQYERRSLMEKQNELKKQEMEGKRNVAMEKQRVASDLANAELELLRKKQSINLERDELKMMKELLEKQKYEFQSFNKNVLNDYKGKLKQVEAQKEQQNQLEIELHRKLHALEMASGQYKHSRDASIRTTRPASYNQENHRNRTNTEIGGKVQETKDRFKEMEALARKNAVDTLEERERLREKVDLSTYMARLNRTFTKH